MRAEERFSAIRRFSAQSTIIPEEKELSEDDAFVFLISTRAGGTGLNLVAADTVKFRVLFSHAFYCLTYFQIKYTFVYSSLGLIPKCAFTIRYS